nr:hypothetical protein [Ishige okamurae]
MMKKFVAKYYFVAASNKFLLLSEPLEEILRERVQHYKRIKKPIDFWLLRSPAFLQSEQMKEFKDSLANDCCAIVSTQQSFIVWLKLRLNHVAKGEFFAPTLDIPKPLSFDAKS